MLPFRFFETGKEKGNTETFCSKKSNFSLAFSHTVCYII